MIPFKALMEAQTGMRGDMIPINGADVLAAQLDGGKLQIGVMHGIEYAWVRQKHTELKPLVIAVNQRRDLYAHLLVRKDNMAGGMAELRDQALARPSNSKLWCDLCLDRQCRLCGKAPASHFSAVAVPATAEDALDDVVEGTVAATVVDGISLEGYQRRKPARFAQLKEL